MQKNNVTSLDECLQGIGSAGISGHIRPDGDCAGSTLAVYNYIKDNYPQIRVKLFLEPIPHIFEFLNRSGEICTPGTGEEPFDLFIALDCSDLERLGASGRYFTEARKTLCIDHHASNDGAFADWNYIFPNASSASELVFELIPRERITKEIAECLYTGIIHDTGVFQYSCTSAHTMAVGGILMEKGIDYPGIVDRTFYTKTFSQNKILGQALLNARLCLEGAVIVSWVTMEEMEKFQALPKHLNGIVNQLRITKDIQVALFLYENGKDSWKGSLRVNGPVNVAEVAAVFGGGGHVKAAGFSIEGPLEEAISRVLAEIEVRLPRGGENC